MRNAIAEYLRLLCRMCGASEARLLLSSGGEGSGVVSTEIRGGVRIDRCVDLALRESPAFSGGFGAWKMDGDGYGGNWRLVRRSGAVSAYLEMELSEVRPPFISRRLSAAGELLGLLELLIPHLEMDLDGSGVSGLDAEGRPFDPPIIGISPAIVSLRGDIRKIAAGDIHALVCGESGTGKELVARNIHSLGPRSAGPFIAVSCLEMPDGLLQGELFGNVRGAYTGADRDREGLIEAAAGGTFFLDEIGELPVHLQAALLRVLQEREIRRLGEGRSRKVDVRFVFATNRELEGLVRAGRFREDLYYRLSAVRLQVPPLRDRREDIPVLAARFISGESRRSGRRAPSITAGALARLSRHSWPGNVRELKNEIARVITMNPGTGRITAPMLRIPDSGGSALRPGGSGFEPGTMPEAVLDLERKMIEEALKGCGGNRTRTAKALGITRQGLLKKMKRMNIDPDRFSDPASSVT